MHTLSINPAAAGILAADYCDACGAAVCDGAALDGSTVYADGLAGDGLELLRYPDGSVCVAIADVARRYCAACAGRLASRFA